MEYLHTNRDLIVRKRPDQTLILLPEQEIEVSLDPLAASLFDAVDRSATLEDLVDFALEQLAASCPEQECLSREEMREEMDAFLVSLLRQGVLSLSRQALFQPCHFIERADAWYVYAPYKRLALQVTREVFLQVKALTVNRYADLASCPAASAGIVPLLDVLNTPVALNENESYQVDFSRRIVMLPTTACNLKCSYCYAWRSGTPVNQMSAEIAEAGIRYVAMNALDSDNPRIDVSFMGGGEPTRNWKTLVHAVEYAREIAAENGVPFSATLTTNGVLTDEQTDWIIRNIDNIKVSFDGIESVQNAQRPIAGGNSFEKASHTLKRLSEAHANFLVRITVTNASIDRLEDSVHYLVDRFTPGSIIINPVYVCGSCASHGVDSIDYRKVVEMFLRVQDLGLEIGVDIVIPYDKVTYMDVPRLPFCGFQKGNCFVTPEGYVSACSEVDGTDDPRSSIFFFGQYDPESGEIVIDEEKESQLHEISVAKNAKCAHCPNNLFCPGPCLVRRIDEQTMRQVVETRKGRPLTAAFDEREFNLLLQANHSRESCIQCEMTTLLSDHQIIRILDERRPLEGISLSRQWIPDIRCEGVLKAAIIQNA